MSYPYGKYTNNCLYKKLFIIKRNRKFLTAGLGIVAIQQTNTPWSETTRTTVNRSPIFYDICEFVLNSTKQKKMQKFSEENIQRMFGNEAAEDEEFDRLQSYYFKSDTHAKVAADLPLRILVGHKGIGKSAIFKMLMAESAESSRLAVLIRPDDITDLGRNSTDFLQIIRDWKSGLLEIIAKKALESVGLMVNNDVGRKILNTTGQISVFLADLFTKRVNDSVAVGPAHKKIIEGFLSTRKVTVLIDDLDRGWQSKREDITRISALLNATRDLSSENRGLYFKISLRTDVYYLVRTSDESTDKIEGSVIWHNWTNHEILLLLIKRITSFYNQDLDVDKIRNAEQRHVAYHLDSVFEKRFTDLGKWSNAPVYRVLMSLIRKRPRDLVKLCTLAARDAQVRKFDLISTINFKTIFEEYSQGRIQDTVNEYKSELPDIERLLLGMKPNKKQLKEHKGFVYTTNELKTKISTILERGRLVYTNGKVATSTDLAQFLYKINFITARKRSSDGLIIRKYFEENRYLSSNLVDFGFEWEVHPAFRWVLQVDDPNEVYWTLELSADDQQS